MKYLVSVNPARVFTMKKAACTSTRFACNNDKRGIFYLHSSSRAACRKVRNKGVNPLENIFQLSLARLEIGTALIVPSVDVSAHI
jgi:hypothetical protein